MPLVYKKFGGKKYTFIGSKKYKRDASDLAEYRRKLGWNVRIVEGRQEGYRSATGWKPTKTVYWIYVRKRKRR